MTEDIEFLSLLLKRANDGLEARRMLQFYYPGETVIVTVSGETIEVDDKLGLESDLAKEFRCLR